MGIGDLVSLIRGGVLEIFTLIAPILGVAVVVGLIVAIFQATTSIQEQTLTFLPKVISMLIMLALLGGWMLNHVAHYTTVLFEKIPSVAR
ncbi:MAG: flagellar biosynthesis protein FliQ [Treponema sp.]|nr:flagellar biosynthesis protein FliQ [Treponema sp.]